MTADRVLFKSWRIELEGMVSCQYSLKWHIDNYQPMLIELRFNVSVDTKKVISLGCSVLLFLAVLNPIVGHTMNVLSPFISVLCPVFSSFLTPLASTRKSKLKPGEKKTI